MTMETFDVSSSAVNAERKRLAARLHNGLGQTMTALLFRTDTVARKLKSKQTPTPAESAQLLELAEKASDDLRAVMQYLRSQ